MATKEGVSTINPIFLLIFAFLCIGGLDSYVVSGRISTIGPGDELNSTGFLVSRGGNFTLGFFTIPETNYTYLGIWYTNDDQLRRVWVANRNNPLKNSSGVAALTIDATGILKIITREGGWTTTVLNISDQVTSGGGGGGNATATLEDTGNFVLKNERRQTTLWQSFDHPTDTLLPGMKLGTNSVTGRNWMLTSWLSESIPASGAFTLTWEPITHISSGELVINWRGDRYWTSGFFESYEFPNMPLKSQEYYYDLASTSNGSEMYFSFSVNEYYFPYSGYKERLLMWKLMPKGVIVDGFNDTLSQYEFCYGYQSASDIGCVVTSVFPLCGRKRFVQKKVRFGGKNSSVSHRDDNSSLSISDCMERCLNNCTCVGFTTISNGTGCITWIAELAYHEEESSNAEPIYVQVDVDVNPSTGSGKKWLWIILAVTISLLLCCSCYLNLREGEKKRRKKYLKELITSDSFNNANEVEGDAKEGYGLNIFSLTSIMEATNNFSNENKLGEGGFGPVYKGTLQEGREIAVKRLSRKSRQGLVEFKNELILIAKLQHKNLVRVLGCCIHEEEKMLIYEFMPNKSLDFFLFDPTKKEQLDWEKRLNIIEGVAQGVLYLHKYSRMRVIHRDLKANNVLLDENMNAKISDFGMAKIFKQNETEATTKKVVGTYGYMSPEYAMEGIFSVKSDVFSFGVLILEIVSGRRNTSFYHFDNRSSNLIGYAWELWKDGAALELKDPTLGDSCATNQLLKVIHVGLLCVQEGATDRPTMSDVISMLSNEAMALPAPKHPAFFTGRNVPNMTTSNEITPKDCSLNNLTISTTEAR